MSFIRSNIPAGNLYEANFSGRPATSWGTTVTADSTAHTLGVKAELIASTSFNAQVVAITIHSTFTAATATDCLANIYTGGGGSEVVLIPNLLAGWSNIFTADTNPKKYVFPIFIPAGTRLTADLQALQTTPKTASIMIELFGGLKNFWTGTGVEALGVTTANSRGATITPGTASEGSFADIGTSTKIYRYVHPMVQGNLADTAITGGGILGIDIGTGGNPISGLENFLYYTSASEHVGNMFGHFGRYATIASGTTLQLRGQASATESDPKDTAIYGVYS